MSRAPVFCKVHPDLWVPCPQCMEDAEAFPMTDTTAPRTAAPADDEPQESLAQQRGVHYQLEGLYEKVLAVRDRIPSTDVTALAVIGEVLSIIEKE